MRPGRRSRVDIARGRSAAQPERVPQGRGRITASARRRDPGAPGHAPGSQRRAAGGKHTGRVGVGESGGVRGFAPAVAGPRGGTGHEGRNDRKARLGSRRSAVRLPAPARGSRHRRSRQRTEHGRRASESGVPALLPDGGGGGACPRVHRHRRYGPGRARARLQRCLDRRERRQARHQGSSGAGRGERGEDPSREPGPGHRAQHRSPNPVSDLPCAASGSETPQCPRRLGGGAGRAHRRGACGRKPAFVQSKRPRGSVEPALPKPCGHRLARAGVDDQAVHGRRRVAGGHP